MGSTGCGIGLLSPDDRTLIEQAAAHGFRTPEWRNLSVRVGEGLIGLAVSSGRAVRSDDLREDSRSVRRDLDEKEGIRSLLSVPLRVGGQIIGVISAFSTEPRAFGDRQQAVLESFADQAGIAIQNARLFEETRRRARETQALLRAGHAVNQSLDVSETVRLILNQAREVLEVQSCGLFTLDAATGELTATASLDLPAEDLHAIRLRVGEGITGVAVKERRPVQTADLYRDPRRYPQAALRPCWPRRRSWASRRRRLTVLRPTHHFSAEEESLVSRSRTRPRWRSSTRACSPGSHLLRAPGGDGGGAHPRARRAAALREEGDVLRASASSCSTRPRVIRHEPEGAALVPVAGPPPVRRADAARQGRRGARLSPRRGDRKRGAPYRGGATRGRRGPHRAVDRDPAARPAGHPRAGPGGGHHAAEAARAPDGADRAAHHRGAAGRRGGARAEQSAGHHRGLRERP
jgi:GAF domain-containing protein